MELVNGRPTSFLYPLAAPRYGRRELAHPAEEYSTVPQLLGKTADGLWGDFDQEGETVGYGNLAGRSSVSLGVGGLRGAEEANRVQPQPRRRGAAGPQDIGGCPRSQGAYRRLGVAGGAAEEDCPRDRGHARQRGRPGPQRGQEATEPRPAPTRLGRLRRAPRALPRSPQGLLRVFHYVAEARACARLAPSTPEDSPGRLSVDQARIRSPRRPARASIDPRKQAPGTGAQAPIGVRIGRLQQLLFDRDEAQDDEAEGNGQSQDHP